MIIIGYQGIGKSTLAKDTNNKFIDLESSNFFVDGKRSKNWYKIYCSIANHLSQQGFIVFTSSHKEVREELKKYDEKVFVCAPNIPLKDKWIQKLADRYHETNLDKDYKALMNAEDRYEDNIRELFSCGFPVLIIHNIEYDLEKLISAYIDLSE